MIDRVLMYRVLVALNAVSPDSIREKTVLDELGLEASRHIEPSEIREHLAEAHLKGWADSSKGPLGETRWRILEAGINTMRDLRR